MEEIFPFLERQRLKKALAQFESDLMGCSEFLLLIALAGVVASLGILRGNQAVLIGAMLITPLVDPFVGVALAIVMRYRSLFWKSLRQALFGTGLLFSIAFMTAFGFSNLQVNDLIIISSLQVGIPEVVLAIAAGLVAAFAMAFEKMSNRIAGAAITLSLAPPLAIAGIDLAQGKTSVFCNAMCLFGLNAGGIVLMSLLVFWLFGFKQNGDE